jgi:transposase
MKERNAIKNIVKYYNEGLSIRKIAQIMQFSRNTVKKIIERKHHHSTITTYKHDTEHLPIELNKEELERYLAIKHNK